MKLERAARLAYLRVIAALGAAATGVSLYRVAFGGIGCHWIILAYLTVLTGTITIAIPGANSKPSVSDAFIFINTILFGTARGETRCLEFRAELFNFLNYESCNKAVLV